MASVILNIDHDFTVLGTRFKTRDKVIIENNNSVFLFYSDDSNAQVDILTYQNVDSKSIKKIVENSSHAVEVE